MMGLLEMLGEGKFSLIINEGAARKSHSVDHLKELLWSLL